MAQTLRMKGHWPFVSYDIIVNCVVFCVCVCVYTQETCSNINSATPYTKQKSQVPVPAVNINNAVWSYQNR